MEPTEATPTSSQNSRRPSLWLMPKEKHEHSYDNSDREKTQQTNISHNSGSLQGAPRSQMTNSLSNTSWKESTQEFCRKYLARTHSPLQLENGLSAQEIPRDIRMKERTHGVPDTNKENKHTEIRWKLLERPKCNGGGQTHYRRMRKTLRNKEDSNYGISHDQELSGGHG